MAIFHLSVKTISRGKGQSAVASAAYRSGSKLYDERYKETHNYANKRFVEYSEIQLPKQAPEAYKDRATLWNAVEKAEKAKNARLAREIELALPKEISLDQEWLPTGQSTTLNQTRTIPKNQPTLTFTSC